MNQYRKDGGDAGYRLLLDPAYAPKRDLGPSGVRVLSLDEVARQAGATRKNLERSTATGTSPPVVRISPRKVGVLEEDFVAWLRARRRPALGKADEREGPNA
jgi:hypothetical protein